MDAIAEDKGEQGGGHHNHNVVNEDISVQNEVIGDVGNEDIPVQNEATGNEDQHWHEENIADPRERPQPIRQPPVRLGYNRPGHPALFCQAINSNIQPWQMPPYLPVHPGWPPPPTDIQPWPIPPHPLLHPGPWLPPPCSWLPMVPYPWQMFQPYHPVGQVGMW
jgi:hypothetical protein